jgi:hypothetical protein
VRYTPLTPDRLVKDLADWINDFEMPHPRIGIDGAPEIGASELSDSIAARLNSLGRPAIRASTSWWWRSAALRLELGRTDIDMLLGGWVDDAALRRELIDPLGPGGTGSYLRRLRDPDTDRSVREPRLPADGRSVLLIDGPFLQAATLPLEAVIHLQVSTARLRRALPPDRQWWAAAFHRYVAEDRPADAASVVVAYDHPGAPAVAWAIDR